MKSLNNQDCLILMAVYNGEKYLREQLDSILAQTDNTWELIAQDDGSKDSSLSTCPVLLGRTYIMVGWVLCGQHWRRFDRNNPSVYHQPGVNKNAPKGATFPYEIDERFLLPASFRFVRACPSLR